MNAIKQRLQAAREALERRTPRERRALVILALTAVVALWAQLLWSAHHERARYARLVGELEVQTASMRQLQETMRSAKAQGKPVAPIIADKAVAEFANGLRAAGITTLEVAAEAPGQIRLAGSAGFDAWLGWIAKTQAEYGIQVIRATAEPAGSPGTVKIEAIVALPGAV